MPQDKPYDKGVVRVTVRLGKHYCSPGKVAVAIGYGRGIAVCMFDQEGPRPSGATVHVLAPLVQIIHATLVIEKIALLLYAVLVSVSYAVAIGCFWTLSSISGTTTGVFKSRT